MSALVNLWQPVTQLNWNWPIRIGALSADEREGFASVQQVDEFQLEILLLQRPTEKEDVRAVVFNGNCLPG